MNAPRSGCPINLTLEALGDRWSLIVIRDLMFGNRRHFRELLTRSEERIASNILADRLTSPSSRRCFGRNSDDPAGVVLTADTMGLSVVSRHHGAPSSPRPPARHARPAHSSDAAHRHRCTAGRSRSVFSRSPRTCCRSTRARCTRRCIASSTRGGSKPSGPSRSWAAGRSITGSPHPGAGNWRWKPASGNACPRPSAVS